MTRLEILAELEKTRFAIAKNASGMRENLDVGKKIQSSVARHAYWWIGGAAILGFVLSGRGGGKSTKPIPAKRASKKSKPTEKDEIPEVIKKTTALTALVAGFKILLPILKPLITNYANKALIQMASRSARRD
ncbi:MAG: hypothetical protein ABI443_09190 [Chthoniobacterales bacterium]